MASGEIPMNDAFALLRQYPEYKDQELDDWKKNRPALLMDIVREINSNVVEFGFSVDIIKNPLDGDERCVVWSSRGDATALQDTSGIIDMERDLVVVKFVREFISYLFERQLIGGLDEKGVFAYGDDLSMVMARIGVVNQTATVITMLCEEKWLQPAHGNKYYCTMRFYQEFKSYLELNRPQDEMTERLQWAKTKAG